MDDMRAGGSAARVAEPLLTNVAHDNRTGVGVTTVAATVRTNHEIRGMVVVLLLCELQVTETRCNAADLAVGYGLRFQLFEAIELKSESFG